MLYLVKAAHILVLTELVGQAPAGRAGQIHMAVVMRERQVWRFFLLDDD